MQLHRTEVDMSVWLDADQTISKYQLFLLAVPLAFFLSSQSFALFLAVFDQGGSIEDQLFVYIISAAMIALEIALFLLGMVAGRRVEPVLAHKRWPVWLACAFGLAGLLFLIYYQQQGMGAQDANAVVLLVCGLLFIALYSTVVLVALGVRISTLKLEDMGFLLGVTGCLYSLISLLQASVSNAGIIVMVASCLLIAFFLPLYPSRTVEPPSNEEAGQGDRSSKGLLPLFFTGSLLCLIAAVFPRLFTTPVFGAITTSERAFISYICIIVFFALMALLSIMSVSRRTISLCFAFCTMVFILSFFLATGLFSTGINEYGTGAIKANQTIFRVFLLILTMFIIKVGRLKPIVAICLYGILVLAVPELVTNAVVKPLNFAYSLHTVQDILIPATALVAIAVVVLSFFVIIMDLNNSRKNVVVDAAEHERLLCEAATKNKGLTTREFDILLYLHRGYSIKKMASLLYISPSTVQSHIANLYKKLDVHSKQDLIDAIDETIL